MTNPLDTGELRELSKYRIQNNDLSVYYHIPDYVLEDFFAHHQKQAEIEARISELEMHVAWADENVGGITLSRQQLDDRLTKLKSMRDEP